jgi:hypothetical protein
MPEPLSWTHPIRAADLPEEGVEIELAPDDESRAALARNVDALAVPALIARLRLLPDGRGGATVEGTLEATVRQTCVVTLEPIDNAIAEPVALRFAPEPEVARSLEAGEANPPDPLIGGRIDLARVVAEFLALAVDPYPRRPGAVFTPPASEAAAGRASAFAALEKLMPQHDKKV